MLFSLIDDYLEYIDRELGCTEKTIYNYKYQFTLFLKYMGDVPVEKITMQNLRDYFRAEEDRGLAISSVNTARGNIRTFFYYLQYDRKLKLDFDCKMIKQKKCDPPDVHVATEDDLWRVLSVLDDLQDKLMVLVSSQTCMRVSELVKLRVEHIQGCEIRTVGKGRKPRPVCVTPELAEALEKHMAEKNIYTGPVFRSRTGKSYSVSGLRNRFRRKLLPHGLHAGFHWYRRGGATDMMRNGADLFFLKEYLGHSDIRTTQRYLRLTDAEKRQKFEMFYKSPINIAQLLT